MCLIWCMILNKHLYLSNKWLDVNLRTNTKKAWVKTRSNYVLIIQFFSILDLIVNIRWERGKSLWSFNNLENLHFDNEKSIHMSSRVHAEYGYGHGLDLLIISHQLHVSYPTRSGWREKSTHLRSVDHNKWNKVMHTNNNNDVTWHINWCFSLDFTIHIG
jgi:hypothetical protein